MQTIHTKYSNGSIMAKCWNGWTRSQYDAELNSEQNHRAAAEKLINKLNANKLVKWGIMASAPAVPGVRDADNGWIFIIKHIPEVAPLQMSITVRFIESTNARPARMRVYSWLFPAGMTIHYPAGLSADIQENARYAAGVMLDRINESCKEHGDLLGYKLADYVQVYNGDRLFVLIPG